jgi:ABC-type nickel/cobalt efflux system permease component RcnA
VGVQRRSAVVAVFAVVATLVVVTLPIKWHSVQWGTVPEWIGVAVLLLIGVGVWSLARNIEPTRDRTDRFR